MMNLYVKLMNQLSNEKGSQSLEWLGIAAVIVIIVGMISQVFGGDTAFGDAIKNKLVEMVGDIG
jgi:cytochrome b